MQKLEQDVVQKGYNPVVVIWIDGERKNSTYASRFEAADALGVTPLYVDSLIESGAVLIAHGRRCCIDDLFREQTVQERNPSLSSSQMKGLRERFYTRRGIL